MSSLNASSSNDAASESATDSTSDLDTDTADSASSANSCLMAPKMLYSSAALASVPFSSAKILQILFTNSLWCEIAKF